MKRLVLLILLLCLSFEISGCDSKYKLIIEDSEYIVSKPENTRFDAFDKIEIKTVILDDLDIEAPGNVSNAHTQIGTLASCDVSAASSVLCWLQDFEDGRFGYQIFYPHTDYENAGTRRCIAYPDSSSISYQICKADTNLAAPDAPLTAYAYFTYP